MVLWDLILQRTNDRCEAVAGGKAIIAGGTVRDFLLGKPHKDIDVFLPVAGRGVGGRWIDLLTHEFGYRKMHVTPFAIEYLNWQPELKFVLGYTICSNEVIQFVGIDTQRLQRHDWGVEAVVERFDFGLSQAAYDGKRIFVTDTFREDRANRTFTVTRCTGPADAERSRKRYERLAARWLPEQWALNIPEEFEPFFAEVGR